MTRVAWPLAALTALALIFSAFPALSAQFFVANSTAPGLEAGDFIDGDEPLSVPAGASITLIDPDGKTVTLTGPLDGPPGGGSDRDDRGLFDVLSKIVSSPDASIATLGETRAAHEGEGGRIVPEDPFAVMLGASGSHCVPADEPVRLWRPDSTESGLLTIWPVAESSEAAVEAFWPGGAATMPWPEELAPEEGATYLIRLAGGGPASEVVLHRVPADLPNEVHRIAWMAEHGCKRQALTLLETLE